LPEIVTARLKVTAVGLAAIESWPLLLAGGFAAEAIDAPAQRTALNTAIAKMEKNLGRLMPVLP
jgi:hypothetical protein